jgi:hypothetical protein
VRIDGVPVDRAFVVDRDRTSVLSSAVGHWQAVVHVRDQAVTYPFARDTAEHPLGRWTHLAGVVDGKSVTLYVDGKKVASAPLIAAVDPRYGEKLLLGPGLEGAMRGVRVSKSARYANDFSPPALLTADSDALVSYDFHEGEGDVLHDTSGHGLDAKILGAKWIPVEVWTSVR